MSTPSEAVRAAQEALNALTEHLDVIDTFAERKAGAEAALAATAKEHDALKVKLRQAQADLDRVSSQLESKAAILDDARARALADINAQIKAGQEELFQLNGQLKEKREAHDAVVASMGSLVNRLDLKRAG